jgi:hypothetical protein
MASSCHARGSSIFFTMSPSPRPKLESSPYCLNTSLSAIVEGGGAAVSSVLRNSSQDFQEAVFAAAHTLYYPSLTVSCLWLSFSRGFLWGFELGPAAQLCRCANWMLSKS